MLRRSLLGRDGKFSSKQYRSGSSSKASMRGKETQRSPKRALVSNTGSSLTMRRMAGEGGPVRWGWQWGAVKQRAAVVRYSRWAE
jgi:hypothetical protein